MKALIIEADQGLANLTAALKRAKYEVVVKQIDDDIDRLGKHLSDLLEERALLLAYIGQGELTPDEIANVKRIAADLGEELIDPDFEAKRFIIDRLHLRVTLRHDASGRWADATCEPFAETDLGSFPIVNSSSTRTTQAAVRWRLSLEPARADT